MTTQASGLKPAKCLSAYTCELRKTCARAHERLSSGPWGIGGERGLHCPSYVDATPILVAEIIAEASRNSCNKRR